MCWCRFLCIVFKPAIVKNMIKDRRSLTSIVGFHKKSLVSEKKIRSIMSKTQIAKIYDTMDLDSETVALYQDAFQLKSNQV